MRVSCQLSDLLCVAYEEVCVCCNHNTFREILQQGYLLPRDSRPATLDPATSQLCPLFRTDTLPLT
jgi:hypothetical protein